MIQAMLFCFLSGWAGALVGMTLSIAGIWFWDHGEPLEHEREDATANDTLEASE